jgi:hypothetical protein
MLTSIKLEFNPDFHPFHYDLSAVTYTPNGDLWLGSDETNTIEKLSFDGEKFTNHQTFDLNQFLNLPDANNQEIDIEGLAYDNYYIWIVGSHSYKRSNPQTNKSDQENLARLATIKTEINRYLLAKIPLVKGKLYQECPHPEHPEIILKAAQLNIKKKQNILIKALSKDSYLKPFIQGKIPSKDNGLDLEGIAVVDNKIFLGLRGPVLRGWAIILQLEFDSSSHEKIKLNKFSAEQTIYQKHFVRLEGLGIRDLCINQDNLLILAGPTMDLDGPVKIFELQQGLNLADNTLSWQPQFLMDIPFGEGNHHAEGMTIINNMEKPAFLLVYDSPASDNILKNTSGVIADIFPLTI